MIRMNENILVILTFINLISCGLILNFMRPMQRWSPYPQKDPYKYRRKDWPKFMRAAIVAILCSSFIAVPFSRTVRDALLFIVGNSFFLILACIPMFLYGDEEESSPPQTKNSKSKTFTGSGYKALTQLEAQLGQWESPPREKFPTGGTWPLVQLVVSRESVDFRIFNESRKVPRQKVERVILRRMGSVSFATVDYEKQFSFMTIHLKTLLQVLEKWGYPMDESVTKHFRIARFSIVLQIVVAVSVVLLITILSIVRPNG